MLKNSMFEKTFTIQISAVGESTKQHEKQCTARSCPELPTSQGMLKKLNV
jgi:hypothetical protein